MREADSVLANQPLRLKLVGCYKQGVWGRQTTDNLLAPVVAADLGSGGRRFLWPHKSSAVPGVSREAQLFPQPRGGNDLAAAESQRRDFAPARRQVGAISRNSQEPSGFFEFGRSTLQD